MAIEADLSDPGTPAGRFDAADQHIGPVEILMNNATGPLKDTFAAAGTDRFARTLEPVSPTSWSRQFAIDVQAAALLIREFAQRPIARRGTRGRGVRQWLLFVAGRAGELEAAIRHRLRMSDSVHAPYT
jgi:3-oxoacyl-[acyl-carrier protein] reductase